MAPGTRRRRTSANSQEGNNLNGLGSSSSAMENPRAENNLSGAGSGTSVAKKKARERATNTKLVEFLKHGGQNPRIEFLHELTRPIGLWAKEWVTELGILTRKWIPLKCRSWKAVTDAMKKTVFERILDSFDVDFSDPHVVSAVDGHIKKLFRDYRAELHDFYMRLPDDVDKNLHPRNDWAFLCAWWETDEFKARSRANKRSREGLEILHRDGSRSFARGMFKMANPETNERPDVISFYKHTHYNTTKGWIAPRA